MALKNVGDEIWKERSKRRVFIFLSVFFVLSMLVDVFVEADKLKAAADEIAIVILGLVAISLFLVWQNKRSLAELKSQNNIVAMLVVLMIIAKVYGIIVEAGTADDFGDEIPVLIGLVVMLANKFI